MTLQPLPFIWRSQGFPTSPNTWTYFRKTFEWSSGQSTKILFSADPTARLWINGAVVLARVMRFVSPQITVEEIDLAPWLREGRNVAVVLHHWWGVPTFQRSRGGSPGFAIQSTVLGTEMAWMWRNAEEFLAHPHQTIGGGAQRIRFPVMMDARKIDLSLHEEKRTGRWSNAVGVESSSWAEPVRKETPALIREEFFPLKIEAIGTAFPPPLSDAPSPDVPVSWLVKHSRYQQDASRAKFSGSILQSLLPGPDGYVTLDFGKPFHGYVRIAILSAPAGATLDFTYGEIREDLCSGKRVLLEDGFFDPELIVGTPFGDRIVLREGAQTIEIPEERTWRWLMVTWRAAKKQVEIQSISVMTSQHPAPNVGSFRANPKEIPKLVDLCLDHAKVTMSDTYVDTPGREDAQWLEDIQYRAQLAAQWFGDTSLRQVTLRHTVELQVASGRFRVFPPEDYGTAGLQTLDWGIVWIGMLYDDWMWTGETTRVRRYFPNLEKFLALAHSQTNPDGLLVDRTCMTDLRSALRGNLDAGEVESIPNAWYYGFLLNAIALAKAVGKTKQANEWQSRAARVRREFARFVSKKSALVAEVWSPHEGLKGFGQAASISAVFHELLTPVVAKTVLNNCFKTANGSPPKGVGRWNNPTYAYRALKSLSDHGLGLKAGAHFLERYRPYLPDGPLPEYFLMGSGQPSDPGGSHGWAAVPLVWMHDTVLGIRLASPSGRKLHWEPVYVGWPKVEGTTITPLGPCKVRVDWKKRHFSIELPEGSLAEAHLPVGKNGAIRIWKNVSGKFHT